MSSEACVSVSILLKLSFKTTPKQIPKEKVYYEQPKNTFILSYCVNYSTALKMTEIVLSFRRKR